MKLLIRHYNGHSRSGGILLRRYDHRVGKLIKIKRLTVFDYRQREYRVLQKYDRFFENSNRIYGAISQRDVNSHSKRPMIKLFPYK